MMGKQTMWVDTARCTGCGVCLAVCGAGAIAVLDGKARIDEEACAGCGSCTNACPEDAIQPAIQGELVPAPEIPAPALHQPGPLTQTAGTALAVAGTRLLVKVARALARSAGRWLMRRPAAARPSTDVPSRAQGSTSRGRRTRHRWRGG